MGYDVVNHPGPWGHILNPAPVTALDSLTSGGLQHVPSRAIGERVQTGPFLWGGSWPWCSIMRIKPRCSASAA
eukprot:3824975-Pyramimonas_sp.AAC.1